MKRYRTARSWLLAVLAALLIVGLLGPTAAGASPRSDMEVPGQPVHVQATAGPGWATITWGAAPYAGSSAITAYVVTAFRGSDGRPVSVQTVDASSGASGRPATYLTIFRETERNVAYSFEVRAMNAAGQGEASRSNPITWIDGVTPPNPPANVKAAAGNGSATVSWTAPSDGGSAITGYEVTVYLGNTADVVRWVPVAGSAAGTTIAGLDNGTAYSFTVRALNVSGWGVESGRSNVINPPGVRAPDAPAGVHATAGDSNATVTWSAPYDGGSPITSYIVTAYLGSSSQVAATRTTLASATSVTLIGVDRPLLSNGITYTFTVVAVNAAGQSPESARSNPVTPGVSVPGAPTGVYAVAGPNSAVVSWSAPSDGGSAITGYVIRAYPLNAATPTQAVQVNAGVMSAALTGLTRGATYTFTAMALNANGWGAESAHSLPVTIPAPTPDAPANVRAVPDVSSATVTWTAPYDGGSPITQYAVTAYLDSGSSAVTTVIVSGDATSATVAGLSPGKTYTFVVAAANAGGRGPDSARSNAVTTPMAAGVPRNLAVTAADGSARVRWDAPISDGGSAITGYQIAASDGVHTPIVLSVSDTAATVAGLTDGVTYTISVAAVNAVGRGEAATASVTPRNEPPTLTIPANANLRYGDAPVLKVSAHDETGDHLALQAFGLPAGLTFTDAGDGTGTVSGTVLAPAGSYTATFSVNDGHNPAVTKTLAITVARADADIQLSPSPAVVLRRAGDRASVTLRATIGKASGDNHAHLAESQPVTYTLTALDSGATYTRSATVDVAGDDTLSASGTFPRLPEGVYRVHVNLGGEYYEGSAESAITLYHPSSGSVQGSGSLRRDGAAASFSFRANYGRNSAAQGTLTYREHRAGGDVVLRGTTIGGLVLRQHRAYIQGRATLDGKGSYTFVVIATEGRLGLWVTDGKGAAVSDLTFSPVDMSSGRTLIRQR